MILRAKVEVILRPATKADIIAYRGKPYRESFRGIVAELEGEVVGVAGVLHTSPPQAFSNIRDALRAHPKTLILGVREFRKILNSYDSQIYAIANEKEKNSTGFLEYVGFEHFNKRIYRWPIQSH